MDVVKLTNQWKTTEFGDRITSSGLARRAISNEIVADFGTAYAHPLCSWLCNKRNSTRSSTLIPSAFTYRPAMRGCILEGVKLGRTDLKLPPDDRRSCWQWSEPWLSRCYTFRDQKVGSTGSKACSSFTWSRLNTKEVAWEIYK